MNMEQPTSNIPCPPLNEEIRKPNNIVSWLGFGFSLFVLILLWATLIICGLILNNSTDTNSGDASIIMVLSLMIGFPLGLAGLILSISGLIKASNKGGKKWIGTCGLVFTALSILSIFIPLIFVYSTDEPTTVTIPAAVETTSTEDSEGTECNIVLLIDRHQLKCYDNREKQDNNPYQTRIVGTFELIKELEVWFTMHNITKEDTIKVEVTNDTDYTTVHDVLDALKFSKMKFQLSPLKRTPNVDSERLS